MGGHCLAVDPYFITGEFKEESALIDTARQVNSFKPLYISKRIEDMVDGNKDAKIAILGMSYKPDIDDFRESPSVILAKDLIIKGYNVKGCDPNTDREMLEGIDMISLDEALSKADLLVIAQNDREFIERKDEIKERRHFYA